MVLGISPMVDFAFLKLFATPQNKLVLIAFVNAILMLEDDVVDLKVLNPFNLKDFEDDQLTILDIKATDSRGRIFNIEMQLSLHAAFVKRIVYYASELYVDQMRSGDDYVSLCPVYAISIIEDVLWKNSKQVHHRFRFTDRDSGRILLDTIEIHTLELGLYNVQESELAEASAADRWLYSLLHAQNYTPDRLKELFPEVEFLRAIDTLVEISEKTTDKAMYDARQKAIRDHHSLIRSAEARGEAIGEARGELYGKIKLLEQLLDLPISQDLDLKALSVDNLNATLVELQARLRSRT